MNYSPGVKKNPFRVMLGVISGLGAVQYERFGFVVVKKIVLPMLNLPM
jgi:hypothetical protein